MEATSSPAASDLRVFSGIKPTGRVHLGNYLGALRHWVDDQHRADSFYAVVDLHALTVEHDPAELRAMTGELVRLLVAIGLDPAVCTLFVQSHVAEHTALSWIMECTASFGELSRMTQFKDKSQGRESVSAGLFTYPALMAADILLYQAHRVPVGDDQRQHLELARDLAIRFNSRYGDTFVVPEAAVPPVGARIMDLQVPTSKMGKTTGSPQGTIHLLDPPEEIERKVRRAVTDSETEVRYDLEAKPGVSNLLSILGAVTGRSPREVAGGYPSYGPLKADVASAVVELVRPIQDRYRQLEADPSTTAKILTEGADKARAVSRTTLRHAEAAVGLLAYRGGDEI